MSTGTARSTITSALADQGAYAQAARQPARKPQHDPAHGGTADDGAENPELGFGERLTVKRERGDEERDREPDPSDGAASEHRRPPHGGPDLAAADARHSTGRRRDAERLADQVGGNDPERERRGVGAREEASVDHDAGIGEGEQRHDHVTGERVKDLLKALVRRDRRAQAGSSRLGILGGRLLAKDAEQVRRPLEVSPRGRVGDRQQAHRQTDDDRIDTGLQERDPGGATEDRVNAAVVNAQSASREHDGEQAQAHHKREHLD